MRTEYPVNAETEDDVRRDAQAGCGICHESGWHWGWDRYGSPAKLRCPCVDRQRSFVAERATPVLPNSEAR